MFVVRDRDGHCTNIFILFTMSIHVSGGTAKFLIIVMFTAIVLLGLGFIYFAFNSQGKIHGKYTTEEKTTVEADVGDH